MGKRPSWTTYLVPAGLGVLGLVIFIALDRDEAPTFFGFLLLLFLGAQLVAVLVDLLQGKVHSPSTFVLLYLLYCLQTALQLLIVFIILPLIIVELIVGPLAFGAAIVTLFGLGLYALEEILGVDVKGMSWYGSDQEALIFLGIFVTAVLVLYFRFVVVEERNFHDKLFDLIARGLEPIHNWQEKLRRE